MRSQTKWNNKSLKTDKIADNLRKTTNFELLVITEGYDRREWLEMSAHQDCHQRQSNWSTGVPYFIAFTRLDNRYSTIEYIFHYLLSVWLRTPLMKDNSIGNWKRREGKGSPKENILRTDFNWSLDNIKSENQFGETCQANTHQLLTWSIVSPVSWANCFFWSSDG